MSKDQGFFVYGMVCETDDRLYIKLGKTRCITKRIRGVQTGCPLPIHMVLKASFETEAEMDAAERRIQGALFGYRSSGEWFCFTKDDEQQAEDFDNASELILGGKEWEQIKIMGPGWKDKYLRLRYEVGPPLKVSEVMSLDEYKRVKRGLKPNFWGKE